MTDAVARIGILEDDESLRLYLEEVLTTTEGLDLAFSEGTVAGARLASAEGRLDLCLVDLKLPDGHGLDFVGHIKATTAAKCLILTVLGDRTSVLLALRAGADGYLLKDTPPDLLRSNIFRTLRGETPISPQAATFLLEMWRAAEPATVPEQSEDALTTREVEVLKLFSRGLSYREAADTLGLSQHTIGDYVKSIYRKLRVHSRTEAIFEARQVGLISPLD
ncbi:MAG: response regulator transcription factor [Caulobacter sp.]|nr:response regulator transcription factor [Caulobacter sp.]